jgi:hypothetical protein
MIEAWDVASSALFSPAFRGRGRKERPLKEPLHSLPFCGAIAMQRRPEASTAKNEKHSHRTRALRVYLVSPEAERRTPETQTNAKEYMPRCDSLRVLDATDSELYRIAQWEVVQEFLKQTPPEGHFVEAPCSIDVVS